MLLWTILFSNLLCYSLSDVWNECFVSHRNIKITCVAPFERRSGLNETQCGQLCASEAPRCQCVQYDVYKQQCDLYDSSSPLDSPIPAKENVQGARRLVRSIQQPSLETLLKEENDLVSGAEERCTPSVLPSIGVVHYSLNTTCLQTKGIPLTPSLRMRSKDIVGRAEVKQIITNAEQLDFDNGPRPADPFKTPIEILPVIPDCANGEMARVQIIDGVRVDAPATVGFVAPSADACIHACRTNAFPDGSRLPLLCRSAQFEKLSAKCATFADALNPFGFLRYIPSSQVLYMEKLCIPVTMLSPSCEESFRRIPQHVLVGHAADILDSTSQQDCILKCVNAYLERGLECRSIVHYTDYANKNCILNFHTRLTRAEFFGIEMSQKVDYVELPQCAYKSAVKKPSPLSKVPEIDTENIIDITAQDDHSSSRKMKVEGFIPEKSFLHDGETDESLLEPVNNNMAYKLPKEYDPSRSMVSLNLDTLAKSLPKDRLQELRSLATQWSEWANCDPATSTRTRVRNCDECKEQSQVQPCFAQTQFDSALSTFLKEQEASEIRSQIRSGQPRVLIPFPDRDRLMPLNSLTADNSQKRKEVEFFGPPNNDIQHFNRF